jgi:hypothetical protein
VTEPPNKPFRFDPTGAVLFVIIGVFVGQLWLLMATMEAVLGGDRSISLPAFLAGLACLALNIRLFGYLGRGDGQTDVPNR